MPHVPASDLLLDLRNREGGDELTVGEIADATGGRIPGLVFVVLGLPETIPMVGFSAILAAPIFLAALGLALRGQAGPLPRWLRRKKIKRALFQRAVDRGLPWIRRLERMAKPRWPGLAAAHRLHGLVGMLLAIVLAVPIPGLNIIAAFGTVGLGIGIIQRDGKLIAWAVVAAVVTSVGTAAVLSGLWAILRSGFSR